MSNLILVSQISDEVTKIMRKTLMFTHSVSSTKLPSEEAMEVLNKMVIAYKEVIADYLSEYSEEEMTEYFEVLTNPKFQESFDNLDKPESMVFIDEYSKSTVLDKYTLKMDEGNKQIALCIALTEEWLKNTLV
jgi:hypothetical protein